MEPLSPADLRTIRRRLLGFYDESRRDLPWRGKDDPYAIWVSEVMLQQTRVETVIPYYRRWMARFPTVDALAAADGEDVLQLWKGLGYYSRARNLHRAARIVRGRFDGRLPGSVAELEELPGVGPYTAGAVASIAFDRPVPAVDGNVRRVLCRLLDLPDPRPAELRDRATALVAPDRPGDFNQALMELGARVCTPSSPECGRCPLSGECLARARGTVPERPPSRSRGPVPTTEVAAAVAVDGGRVLVARRPEDGLLGGMWEFPGAEPREGEDVAAAARRAVEERLGGAPSWGSAPPLGLRPVEHAFSHLRVTYRPVLLPVRDLEAGTAPDRRVLPLDRLDRVPLSVAQQEIGERALRGWREAARGEG